MVGFASAWSSATCTVNPPVPWSRPSSAVNLYVRRLLCEFAHAASRTKSVFKSKFEALIIRRGRKRSIVALAHKLLRTIYFMLDRGEYYRDSATDYEALSVQRNAAR